MARAAAAEGTVMTLSTAATSRPAEIAAEVPPASRWFQLYCFSDRGVTRALVDEAVDSGFEAIVLTADAPRAGRRERDLRSGFAVPADVTVPAVAAAVGDDRPFTPKDLFDLVDPTLDWDDLASLAAECSVPILLKGVQTAEDATLAVEHGAAGVVVSNHGGRQLDGVAASLDILPEVVDAVGERCEVLMDGGVRRGTDVAVALALGARAVLAGGRRSGGWRSAARRGRGGCSNCCGRRSCSRWPCSAARPRTRCVGSTYPRPYIRSKWRNDTLARRPSAGSTGQVPCSRPPTATSARPSTTRSGWWRCTRSDSPRSRS